jgi:hypothetical protein
VRVPEGFKHLSQMADYQDSAGQKLTVVNLLEDASYTGVTLDEAASSSRRSKSFKTPERLEDVELDGVPAYHLHGVRYSTVVFDEFGALRDGHLVVVDFSQPRDMTEAERQKVIESSLATFQWR